MGLHHPLSAGEQSADPCLPLLLSIVPEMIGSVIGVYNGKVFNIIEIKAEMLGFYLAEFSISYKPVRHGRPGIGATKSSTFVAIK